MNTMSPSSLCLMCPRANLAHRQAATTFTSDISRHCSTLRGGVILLLGRQAAAGGQAGVDDTEVDTAYVF